VTKDLRINRRQALLAVAGTAALAAWARFAEQPIKLLVGHRARRAGAAFTQYILADTARYRSGVSPELIKQVMQ